MKATHPLRKLRINLDPHEWHGRSAEMLWVEKVSQGRYRIRNSPFLAKGVSFLDVVNAEEERGDLVYKSTSLSSGHSTYRISLMDFENRMLFEQYWKPLAEQGCTFESAMPEMKLYSVDVPPAANIREVYELLKIGERERVWEFEEGHCAAT